MHSLEFDITIIGGGCVGSSIFYELSRRGFGNTVLLDHGRKTVSATSQSGGMVRVFHESPDHMDLALGHLKRVADCRRAGVLTESPTENGSLYFFHSTRLPRYQSNFMKMGEAGYPFEILTASAGRGRFPEYRWNEEECAVYEPRGSHFSPLSFSEGLLNAGVHLGSQLQDDFEVKRIFSHRDRFRISGNDTTLTTKLLILAGGARLLPRLGDLGLHFPLEAKPLTVSIAEKSEEGFLLPNYFDRESLEYGRFGAGPNVLLSNFQTSRIQKRKWSETREEKTTLDCYAPNRIGATGHVPGYPNLILATGWGGTAFKFALEIGSRVADSVEQAVHERRMIYA